MTHFHRRGGYLYQQLNDDKEGGVTMSDNNGRTLAIALW
jgi:hypothetical protein